MSIKVVVKTDKRKYVGDEIRKRTADAIRKACFDTEAKAKQLLTEQNAIDTGATKASIYSDFEGHHGYADAASEAHKVAAQPGTHSGTANERLELNSPVIADKPFTGIVTVGTHYAPYIEYGTTSMPPRPFIRPAFDYVKTSFLKVMSKILKGLKQ